MSLPSLPDTHTVQGAVSRQEADQALASPVDLTSQSLPQSGSGSGYRQGLGPDEVQPSEGRAGRVWSVATGGGTTVSGFT